jgi:UDP-galactopyranose mutase
MSRFSRTLRVFFFEEPHFSESTTVSTLSLQRGQDADITIVTPNLPAGLSHDEVQYQLKRLLDGLVAEKGIKNPIKWYYTPAMHEFSRHIAASCVVYDCMDELANFRFAAPELPMFEAGLIREADLVFTGGYSLYEAKRALHSDVHFFPSSVDRAHFMTAREGSLQDPEDQAALPFPRLGFYGVVDERMDLPLVGALADARPDWSIVIVGPVAKISPENLPRRSNIHYLGAKTYQQLPAYLAGWGVCLMPFAINEATRFISPTKTPEYLAAGRPVASTPIVDVVRQYGDLDGVRIAGQPEDFVLACDAALAMRSGDASWLTEADRRLADMSWDETQARMEMLVAAASRRRAEREFALSGIAPAALTRAPAPLSRRGRKAFDDLVVGAGFAGSVLAERLAAGSGRRVMVIDRRPHIGGNAYDYKDEAGILVHKYGPHIFHTNSQQVVDYLSRFTKWRPYEHRVLASTEVGLTPIPINRTTLNLVYGIALQTDAETAAFLAARAEFRDPIATAEDVVVSAVGRDLYERFFRGYTRKQWGMDPSELDKSVTARVPTRTNADDRYFSDSFQAMPLDGYTRMFEAMLSHPNISLDLGADFAEVRDEYTFERLIYTGPIDEYYSHCFGKLPYRCLSFKHETLDVERFQPVAVVNYPSTAFPHTRITEYKHLTGQIHPKTSITYEYPSDQGDPYYPVPRAENQALYRAYEALADAEDKVVFVGRLATYRYYNMDQVVGQALATYRRLVARQPCATAGSAIGAMAPEAAE